MANAEANVAAERESSAEDLPTRLTLHQNRPNPFAEETQIAFELPLRTRVRIEVFDLAGRRVATVTNTEYAPGRYSVSWNRSGSSGRVPAGIYTYRMTAGGQEFKRQLVVF